MRDVSYGVRELQARLGQALRAVQRGDRVIITSHGRPVAKIDRVTAETKALPAVERKLLRLAAEGRLVLGKRGPIPDYVAPRVGGLAEQVLSDRR
ncbi:MAG TPA: type II toxin-antitoxin system prevent-host-death family antitoxin [Planctomycetota bacterium]|nr:type II toxin-antitoxin system prevent-host-death family antitoxin [Planctomycetota bacterium]